MPRKNSSVEDRQRALQQEEQRKKDSERSFTTEGIKSMYKTLGDEIHCTISALPDSGLKKPSENPCCSRYLNRRTHRAIFRFRDKI